MLPEDTEPLVREAMTDAGQQQEGCPLEPQGSEPHWKYWQAVLLILHRSPSFSAPCPRSWPLSAAPSGLPSPVFWLGGASRSRGTGGERLGHFFLAFSLLWCCISGSCMLFLFENSFSRQALLNGSSAKGAQLL